MEGGYVNPLGSRAHGLSDFVNDLAQRSFTLVQPPPTIELLGLISKYVPQKYTISSLEEVIARRPYQYSVMLNLVTASTTRYVELATIHGLADRTIYFTISNFLNAVALGFIQPGAWPNKLQGFPSVVVPEVLRNVDPDRLVPMDLTDTLSYTLSRPAHNRLISMGLEDGYIEPMGDGTRRKISYAAYGISNYLETLSYSDFVDVRPPQEPGDYVGMRWQWMDRDFKKSSHPLRLSIETRARYIVLAHRFEIVPQRNFTETSITSSVLEAIGLEFLKPVTRPTKTLQHGPTL